MGLNLACKHTCILQSCYKTSTANNILTFHKMLNVKFQIILVLSVQCMATITATTASYDKRPNQPENQMLTGVNLKLNDKLHQEQYDKRRRPFATAGAVNVTASLHVKSLRSISEETMDYQIELYFSEQWCDNRLAYDVHEFQDKFVLQLHESMIESIWSPDTFFPNSIHSLSPESKSVTHRSLLRLSADGCILYSRRISVTAECPMHLRLYPFDQQTCKLSIESFGSTTDEVQYSWNHTAVRMAEDLALPMFKVTEVLTIVGDIHTVVGSFSRLECCFILERNSSMFYFQIYIPAIAIVIMAWIVMWMRGLGGAAFSDLISVLLAMILHYFTYHAFTPKVSYLKALDVFMVVSFLFVFAALVKQSVVLLLTSATDEPDYRTLETVNKKGRPHRNSKQRLALMLERCCKISNHCYIILYGLFIILYFTILTTVSPDTFHQHHSVCKSLNE